MSTQITGYSDDTIDIDGDICDDFDCFYLCGGGKGDDDPQYVLACSDGTILRPKYGQVGAFCFFEKLRERRTKRRHCTSGANLGRLGAIHSVVHKNEFLNPLTGKNLARGRKQPPPGFHGLLCLVSRNCEDKRNDVARRVVHQSNAGAEALRREVRNGENADFCLLADEERTLVFVVETFVNESFRPFEM